MLLRRKNAKIFQKFQSTLQSLHVGKQLICYSVIANVHNNIYTDQHTHTPPAHALPMFREEQGRSLKRKRDKARADPKLSHKPEPPLPGKGAGGRVGSGSSLGSYVRKIAALEKVDKDVDPREALLKYAKVAADNPYWVAPAYAGYVRRSMIVTRHQ